MYKLFMMIFESFIWVANFGTKMFSWFSSLARFAMFSKAIRVFLFMLFYAFLLLLLATSLFFFYYMVTNIIKVYNLISFLFDYISSAGQSGDSIVSATFFFLTISGIVDGFKAFFPFVASAILFILIKALYRITLFFYMRVWYVIQYMGNVV